MAYSVIDIGSNTIRLCVYDRVNRQLRPLLSKKAAVGLISYLDGDGRMTGAGVDRACRVLEGFNVTLNDLRVDNRYAFATACLRNAVNGQQAAREISRRTGIEIQILSGEQEALADFYGVADSCGLESGVLVDIGGGSTQLVGFAQGQPQLAASIPLGSLNCYDMYVTDTFPAPKELESIREAMRAQLSATAPIPEEEYTHICGVGGSIRGAFKLYNSILQPKNREAAQTISSSQLKDLIVRLNVDRRDRLEYIEHTVPDRVKTILPGITILETVVNFYGADSITVSPFGVREGYLNQQLKS